MVVVLSGGTDSADEVCAERDDEDPDETCVALSGCCCEDRVGLAEDDEPGDDAETSMMAEAAEASRRHYTAESE